MSQALIYGRLAEADINADLPELRAIVAEPGAPILAKRYASLKADAITARLAGRIVDATAHEDGAERVYHEIPLLFRW